MTVCARPVLFLTMMDLKRVDARQSPTGGKVDNGFGKHEVYPAEYDSFLIYSIFNILRCF